MSKKQAQKQPKTAIQGRVNAETHTDYLKWGESQGIKKPTQILEHLLNAFFSGQSTSKPLEQTPSKVSIPQGCLSCRLDGHLVEIEEKPMVMCTLKELNKQPNIKYRSLDEAKVCSERSTLISKATQEEYDWRIRIADAQTARAEENEDTLQRKDAFYEKIRKTLIEKDQDIKGLESYLKTSEKQLREANHKLEPMQDLLGERDRLKCGLSEMENKMTNGLLERDEKIAVLETDNEQIRARIAKLSENELLTENDSLRVQLIEKGKLIDDYAFDIKKLEALTQKQKQTLSEAISQMNSGLREFRQFLPTSDEPHAIGEYIRAMQKKIENLEGYLNTINI